MLYEIVRAANPNDRHFCQLYKGKFAVVGGVPASLVWHSKEQLPQRGAFTPTTCIRAYYFKTASYCWRPRRIFFQKEGVLIIIEQIIIPASIVPRCGKRKAENPRQG